MPPTKLDLLAAASADTARTEAEQGTLRLSYSGIPTPAELAEARRQYDEVVARYTNPDGTRKPGWKKAPNGADTHLTERQWVQVRTPNFKRWFGDWEARYYSQGWQDKIDPAAIRALPALDISGYAPLADKAAIAEAFETFGEVTNANDGRKVRFPANVAGRMVYKRNYVGAFKKLFETSVKAWSENETQFEGHKAHPNIRAYHQYVNKFTDAAGEHYVRFTVREDNPGKGAQNNIHGAEVTAVEVYEKGNDSTLPEFQTGRSESPDGARTSRRDRKLALFLSDFNPSSVSKVVDENGEPLVVWHGSHWDPLAEEPGKAVFRDAYRGTGSGDNGFFGRGFYFAFTEDEAQTYGRRTGGYFLNLRNPFVFIDEMDFIDGLRTFDMAGSDVAPIVNLSDKFPETASMFTVTGWTFDVNGEGTPTEVSLRDFAKEIRAILAEPEIREKRDPITEALSEFQKRHGFGSVDIPRITQVSQEPEFTDELKKKGHDGVLQSKDGDEAVAFSPSQVKSATDNTGVFSARSDIRYSISGLYTGSAADYAERVPVLDKDGNVTGYRIDNAPSLQYVGTGEGSQVYGWGLYASDQRGVAEGYSKARGNNSPLLVDGKSHYDLAVPIEEARILNRLDNVVGWNVDDGMSQDDAIRDALRASFWTDEERAVLRKYEGRLSYAHRNVYEQTFFTDRADGEETERHLLKWYEEVPRDTFDRIVSALKEEGRWGERDGGRDILGRPETIYGTLYGAMRHSGGEWTGGDVYELVRAQLGADENHGAREASEWLAAHGIDGIKYPVDSYGKTVKDGDSAGWNYVTFRDDNIRVDHKWVDGVQRYSIVPVPSAFDPGRLPRSMKWGTLHGHDGNIVGLVAMCRLVGKRLTNDEISDLAQRLGVEMSAKEIKAAAQDLADSEIGALALGRAANGDMAGGMAILAGTAEPPSTDRELVDAAFRAGAKRGMAADAMRRKVTADVLAAQRGADLSEIVREFGFDVAKMLHSWEIEAEKRPEGTKPLDTLPNPYDFAGAMEDPDGTKAEAHAARVAEARRVAAERFSALFDEARRMQEYREEVDAETAGKSGGGTGGDAAAAGDDPGDLPEPFRPEALPIPAELIAQTGLDIRDAATFALALRVGIRDMIWRADPTHEGAFGAGLSGDRLDDADYEFWRNPAAPSTSRTPGRSPRRRTTPAVLRFGPETPLIAPNST